MSTSAPDYFVQLPMTTDADTLADNAIEGLRTAWADTNWEPNDGDPEVVNIETIAPMAANAAAVASLMPKSALINYGVKLLNVPYQSGSPASTMVTFTLESNAGGLTVNAGAQLAIDGYVFNVVSDLVSAEGSYTVTGEVSAADDGVEFNGLVGSVVMPLTTPPFVVTMAVDAPTDGGIDPQDDDSYASDISQELQLTIRTIVTLPNFETAATAIQGIARAHAQTDSARNVTVWVLSTDPPTAVSTDLKDELAAIYQANRIVNCTVAIDDPTFHAISVTWAATVYAGFDLDDFVGRANSALAAELSAEGYGAPSAGDQSNLTTQWYNEPVIRAARLATVISRVDGCYDVTSVAINGGSAGADYTMSGSAPLPTPGTFTGTATPTT